jgi:hypothetical protein
MVRGLATLAVCLMFVPAVAAPRMRVDNLEIDLGSVVRGETREAVIEIHNDGDRPLIIDEVITGCACTVAEFDRTIAPGKVGRLQATVDSTTLRGDVGRLLQLNTNDPVDPMLRINLRINVLTSVEILPGDKIVLGNGRGLKTEQELLVLKSPDETGVLTIGELESDNPGLEIEAERFEQRTNVPFLGTAAAGDWKLRVRLRPDAAAGSSNSTLRFSTGLEREPSVTVTVKTNVARPVNLVKDRVKLARGPENALSVHAMVRRGLDVSAMRVQSPHKGLLVTAEPGEGRAWTLRLEATDAKTLPAGEYKVRLGIDQASTWLTVEVP